MKSPGRKCFGGFIAIALGYIAISGVGLHMSKAHAPNQQQERLENKAWVGSSKNWINKQLCGWLGLCGISHLNRNGWTWDDVEDGDPPTIPDVSNWWTSGSEDPSLWPDEERKLREIPQYVLDHAPYVHLFSEEQFWPCDIAEHLVHITPHVNYTKVVDLDHGRNLTNLNELNDYEGSVHGRFMYLQSNDNVEERPRPNWLTGKKNIPTTPESVAKAHDGQATWLEPGELGKSTEYHNFAESVLSSEDPSNDDSEPEMPTLIPSTNGRCGGNTDFTCKGSKFGKCCSIYGWCGNGDAYCGDACVTMAGECRDPFEPIPKPHTELRRHARDLSSTQHEPSKAGRSSAPVILVVVPKENGIVDAFWFFFYSFNLGQKVFGIRFGNHIGDWEHTLIRFKDGKPDSAFLSEHNFGDAYTWHALEKYVPSHDGSGTMIGTWSNATAGRRAKRPVVYSALGSHAMYAKPGLHPYILPWGILHDQTDRGPLWDPLLNLQAFTWDIGNETVRAATRNPKAPTEWFHYAGHWGDKYYPLSDKRQYRFAGQYHYVNGPTGPRFKRLQRKWICQNKQECHVRQWASGGRVRLPLEEEQEEEGGLPGGNSTDDATG